MDDSTVFGGIEPEQRLFVNTGYDLLVKGPQLDWRTPVCYTHVFIGRPGKRFVDVPLDSPEIANRQAALVFHESQLFFVNHNPKLVCLVNGRPAAFQQLHNGDRIEVGAYELRLVSVLEHLATLELYGDAGKGPMWGVGSEPVHIGRPGKRSNHVELKDPSVSREQATIYFEEGTFFLKAETEGSPTRVNGDGVNTRQFCTLRDGDLIQVGNQLLRFRSARSSNKPRQLLAQEATILFSDIWDYSTMSENRPLEETIGQMNEFYRAMGKVIEGQGGHLMTFLGDALMAVFGAEKPDPAAPGQAVAAALTMQERLQMLNRHWGSAGKPQLKIGVGINTGEVMVGDVGFTGKFEFAAMGDNTNLAARLEKLTRELQAEVVISGSTEKFVRDRFLCKSLGATSVKGREKPVEIYQVLGEKR